MTETKLIDYEIDYIDYVGPTPFWQVLWIDAARDDYTSQAFPHYGLAKAFAAKHLGGVELA